jgi:hypothetical protein
LAFPKLTREQLLDRCDLAGVARVVSVGRANANSPQVAKLVFLRVTKGDARVRGGFVHVRLKVGDATRAENGFVSWSDRTDYKVGATISTHLDWSGPDELYLTTWPGAVAPVAIEVARVA